MKRKIWVVALIIILFMVVRHHQRKHFYRPVKKLQATPTPMKEIKEDFDFPFPGNCIHISM